MYNIDAGFPGWLKKMPISTGYRACSLANAALEYPVFKRSPGPRQSVEDDSARHHYRISTM
jgi:hypothetical protein